MDYKTGGRELILDLVPEARWYTITCGGGFHEHQDDVITFGTALIHGRTIHNADGIINKHKALIDGAHKQFPHDASIAKILSKIDKVYVMWLVTVHGCRVTPPPSDRLVKEANDILDMYQTVKFCNDLMLNHIMSRIYYAANELKNNSQRISREWHSPHCIEWRKCLVADIKFVFQFHANIYNVNVDHV